MSSISQGISSNALEVILHTISEYVDVLQMTDDELLLLGWEADIDVFMRRLPRVPRLVALKLEELTRFCLPSAIGIFSGMSKYCISLWFGLK